MSKKKAGFWSVFGKFSAVVFVIATLVGLRTTLFPGKPRLVAEGQIYPVILPPDFVKTLKEVREKESATFLEGFLKEAAGKSDVSYGVTDIGSKLAACLDGAWGTKFHYLGRYSGFPYESLVLVTMANRGRRTATEVALNVPAAGICVITYQDGREQTVEVSQRVALGSIMPGDTISLVVWAERTLRVTDEDKFRFSHTEGTAKVLFTRQVGGVLKFLADNSASVWLVLLLAILVGLVSLSAHLSQRSQGERPASESGSQDEKETP